MYLSWSYRYFASYLGCAFLALVGFAYRLNPKKTPRAAAFITILSGAPGIGLCVLPGETNGEGASLAKVLSMKQVEKQMSGYLWLLENSEGAEDIYDFYPMLRYDKKILICNSVDQIHSYLYGENNSNDITYCTVNEVQEKYYDGNWDAIMISTVYDIDKTFLEEGGYICYKPSQIFQEVWIKKSNCLDDS